MTLLLSFNALKRDLVLKSPELDSELEKMLSGIKARYALAGWHDPLVWYTDKCCQDASQLKRIFPTTILKGDIYHYMNRIISCVKNPRAAPSIAFMADVGQCFLKKRVDHETRTFSQNEVSQKLDNLIARWEKRESPMTPSVKAAINRVKSHVNKGCVTDEVDTSIYETSVQMMHNKLKQVRGTSQLETRHKHLKSVLNGRTHGLKRKLISVISEISQLLNE